MHLPMKAIRSSSLRHFLTALAAFALAQSPLTAAPYTPPESNRVDFNFNADWKFMMSDAANAQTPTLDDSTWAAVSLPHTYNDNKFREWISTRNETKVGS